MEERLLQLRREIGVNQRKINDLAFALKKLQELKHKMVSLIRKYYDDGKQAELDNAVEAIYNNKTVTRFYSSLAREYKYSIRADQREISKLQLKLKQLNQK